MGVIFLPYFQYIRSRGFLTPESRRELLEASQEAGMMNPEEALHFDPGSFMEFLDMEVEGGDWGPEGHHDLDPIERQEPRMDQAGGPARPPAAENAANSRPSLCNNFIDDYKLAEVLKMNGLQRLRIFIVGVLGKSRTKVALTETRFVSLNPSCAESLYLCHINVQHSTLFQSLQVDFELS